MTQGEGVNSDSNSLAMYATSFYEQAGIAGLREPEIDTLYGLCSTQTSYPTYPSIAGDMAALKEAQLCKTEIVDLGHSSDSEDRRIQAALIGEVDPHAANAYIVAPGHANERAGVATARVLKWLFAEHPVILERYGFAGGAAVCEGGDPDGMLLQAAPTSPVGLADFSELYRGAVADQVSWSYPHEGYDRVTPEVAASLRVLNRCNSVYAADLHGAILAGYVAMNDVAEEGEAMRYGNLMSAFDLPISEKPDELRARVFKPGVFQMPDRKTLSRIQGETEEEVKQYGASIIDCLRSGSRYFNPDFASYRLSGDPTELTDKTYVQTFRHRMSFASELSRDVGKYLGYVQDWVGDEGMQHPNSKEIARLYRAAAWWTSVGAAEFEGLSRRKIDGHADGEKLRRGEAIKVASYPIPNTIMYLGNVRRLAEMAGQNDVVEEIKHETTRAWSEVDASEPIPLPQQVAVQAISVLLAMRGMNLKRNE